jgi:hypothetical protein
VGVQKVLGGKLTLDVSVLGLKVAHRSYDLCTDLDVACPVHPGQEVCGCVGVCIHSGLCVHILACAV